MPELAGIGQAPQSAAKAASERRCSGLSPAAIRSAAAFVSPDAQGRSEARGNGLCDVIEFLSQAVNLALQVMDPASKRPQRLPGSRGGATHRNCRQYTALDQLFLGREMLKGCHELCWGCDQECLELLNRFGAAACGGITSALDHAQHLSSVLLVLATAVTMPACKALAACSASMLSSLPS